MRLLMQMNEIDKVEWFSHETDNKWKSKLYQECWRAQLDVAQCFFLQFFCKIGALERNTY